MAAPRLTEGRTRCEAPPLAPHSYAQLTHDEPGGFERVIHRGAATAGETMDLRVSSLVEEAGETMDLHVSPHRFKSNALGELPDRQNLPAGSQLCIIRFG